jgi:hypothetical protein
MMNNPQKKNANETKEQDVFIEIVENENELLDHRVFGAAL